MAREASNREDLLREATALVERIELSPRTSPLPRAVRDRERGSTTIAVESPTETIVIGFRANGAVSIFFGADPVYQYNTAGELRRAYCDGLLFKAVRRRLVSLERVRQRDEVQLVSRELTTVEQHAFVNRMGELLDGLTDGLELGCYRVAGQVPAESDVLRRVLVWLAAHNEFSIAASPRVV